MHNVNTDTYILCPVRKEDEELVESLLASLQSQLEAETPSSNTLAPFENIDQDPWNLCISVPPQTDNLEWLENVLRDAVNFDKILALLTSKAEDEMISEQIVDIFGYDHIDYAQQTLLKRMEIVSEHRIRMSNEVQTTMDGKMLDLEALEAARKKPNQKSSFKSHLRPQTSEYPFVFTTHKSVGEVSIYDNKYVLGDDTEQIENEAYQEIIIPPSKALPMGENEQLITVSTLDFLAKMSFSGYTHLNRLQSLVYPVAYNTNENMLICAPTGAGKTDVAMLTVLRALGQFMNDPEIPPDPRHFKIVYIAPMKALASEVVRKFSQRLTWLNILVKELTGDMQLSKSEVSSTHIIVTTPEKWDVVTRKPTGEGEVASHVKTLIIDEVHLLHDERGAVIESLVARTLRQVESSQSPIRIVGLSATLPNYIDVAEFLRVNPYQGLFYFDSSFRPIPLEQHFIGVRGKVTSTEAKKNLDVATFDKVLGILQEEKQVMVFVHTRKDTVKTAETLSEMMNAQSFSDLVDPTSHPQYRLIQKDLAVSRNKELKTLIKNGFGIHNAGMLRSDRHLSERLFEMGVIKVLVCTATLAWGINLPAYAVIIKGTQVFDSSKGGYKDLSVLDVLQIFGRAGRPQFENKGVGYICTSEDKIHHYLSAITQQNPIESSFVKGLVDALNAEVTLGTVRNVDEGVRWVGWTYLFVRLQKNPTVYGITRQELEDDPSLGSKRLQLITQATNTLASAQMVVFDEDIGTIRPTELGKIAARYYLRHASIEIFNQFFTSTITSADFLKVLCSSVEFNQIMMRESENEELSRLLETSTSCQIQGGLDNPSAKINVLLQTYISRGYVEDFALIADMNYVSQNAGRIARSLFEIALSRKWAQSARVALEMCKSIEKRMWPFDHPLQQFSLKDELMFNVREYADEWKLEDLAALPIIKAMDLLKINEKSAKVIQTACKRFPRVEMNAIIQPLSNDSLQIQVKLNRLFEWSHQTHGDAESFHILVINDTSARILGKSRDIFQAHVHDISRSYAVSFAGQPFPSSISVGVMWERWIGSDDFLELDLHGIHMPPVPSQLVKIQPVPCLNVGATGDSELISTLDYAGNLDIFQTHTFHSLYHTSSNVLVSSPYNYKDIKLIILTVMRNLKRLGYGSKILILTARKERTSHLKTLLSRHFPKIEIREFGDKEDGVIFVGDGKSIWVELEKNGSNRSDFGLVIADELHVMNYEMELSLCLFREKCPGARLVGLSGPLVDGVSISAALDVPASHQYVFERNKDEQVAAEIEGYEAISFSVGVVRKMMRGAYGTMRSSVGGTICILPTWGLCREVMRELMTITMADMAQNVFVGDAEGLEAVVSKMETSDVESMEALHQGIGVISKHYSRKVRLAIMELFRAQVIKVLIFPRETIWEHEVIESIGAGGVIVMGTTYRISENSLTKPSKENTNKVVRQYNMGDILLMQSFVDKSKSPSPYFKVMCMEDEAEKFKRWLEQGVGLESELLFAKNGHLNDAFETWLLGNIIFSKSLSLAESQTRMLQILDNSVLKYRLHLNPDYYAGMINMTNNTKIKDHPSLEAISEAILDERGNKKLCLIRRYPKHSLQRENVWERTYLCGMLIEKQLKQNWSELETINRVQDYFTLTGGEDPLLYTTHRLSARTLTTFLSNTAYESWEDVVQDVEEVCSKLRREFRDELELLGWVKDKKVFLSAKNDDEDSDSKDTNKTMFKHKMVKVADGVGLGIRMCEILRFCMVHARRIALVNKKDLDKVQARVVMDELQYLFP